MGVSRRQVLRAGWGAGVALGLPWLQLFADPPAARAASRPKATAPPARMGLFFWASGVIPERWVRPFVRDGQLLAVGRHQEPTTRVAPLDGCESGAVVGQAVASPGASRTRTIALVSILVRCSRCVKEGASLSALLPKTGPRPRGALSVRKVGVSNRVGVSMSHSHWRRYEDHIHYLLSRYPPRRAGLL